MATNGRGRRQFGDFEFDADAGKLFRDGQTLRIQPQPLRVLEVLVERPGEIVLREELRNRIWGEATFVEFDQGLNYCIRQIRATLGEAASQPIYIETLPKQGYRFIAEVTLVLNGAAGTDSAATDLASKNEQTAAGPLATAEASGPTSLPVHSARRIFPWLIATGVCAVLAIAGLSLYFSLRPHRAAVAYTQLTDFTDSAVAPALSPDGRMLAFIRGSSSFLDADQIYMKMLPDGEPKRLTDDPRPKYGLVFSPDGSQIAYTVLDPPTFATYTVSILGGDSHLFLNNAAGLTWLDQHQLLFSQIRTGMHLGVVTGTVTDEHFRELYFPPHERGMAHYAYASPDRRSALVVEMNGNGEWVPCLLLPLDGASPARPIGPHGPCTSAGWSPDGSWMYFIATVEGHSHLWRQRFPNGRPEQITFGPTEEDGLAVERDGRSVITSMGVEQSSIWLHDAAGDRSMSSEGEVVAYPSPPSFSADDKLLYYLLRRESAHSGPELWRMTVASGSSEAVFPGISILDYDVSPDGKQVLYSTAGPSGKSQLWLAPADRSSPAKRVGTGGETSPHFGPRGQILFRVTEGTFNYLERMNPDGSGRSRVVPYPISEIQGVSPGRRWVMALIPFVDGNHVGPVAIPTEGGSPLTLCPACSPTWSSSGRFVFVQVEDPSRTSPGRSLAIPVGPGESLPAFPPGGIKQMADASVMPGAESVPRAELVPGKDPSHYAYVNTTVHRNLYRISLP